MTANLHPEPAPDQLRSPIFSHSALVAAVVTLITAKLLAILLRLDGFEIWQQVIDLHNYNVGLLDLVWHPHFLRYLLVWPIFEVSDLTGIDRNLLFGLACVGALSGATLLTARTASLYPGVRPGAALFISALVFFSTSLVMNGRMVFGFLGFSLVLWIFAYYYATRRWPKGGTALLFVGVLLCSVSSGAVTVAFAFVGAATLYGLARPHSTASVTVVSATIVMIVFATTIVQGATKNLDFYGGGLEGLIGMLEHGAGRVLDRVDPAVILSVVPLLAIWFLIALWLILQTRSVVAICLIAMGCAMVGGIFGFSTLTLILVPIAVVTSIVSCNLGHKYFVPSITAVKRDPL